MKLPSPADLKYYGRWGIVAAKQMAKVSRSGDKTFFIERLSRLLRSGRVGPQCKVLALGKNDGAGSQAFTLMSALAFAKSHGVTYVHRPFEYLEHETGADAVRAWEDYFNLGAGELSLASCQAPQMPIEDFLAHEDMWRKDVIVTAEHFLHYCNLDPGAWPGIVPELRRKYRRYDASEAGRPFLVCVHMRRGDVSATGPLTAKNFTPNAVFLSTVKTIAKGLDRLKVDRLIEVHSQGDPAAFAEFSQLGCHLRLDEPAMQSHQRLVNADALVMSRSSFSFTAALLNRGAVLYDPQKYLPMPNWIVRSSSGAFDEKALERHIEKREHIAP